MTTSDERFIAEYRSSGDLADLEELIDRHLATVRGLAFRIVLSDAAADDITQDVFLQVIRNLDSFRGEAKFSTWLYRITMNSVKSHLRKEKPRDSAASSGLEEVTGKQAQPDSQAIGRELGADIERALSTLSTKLRSAIVLTSLNRLSPAEAAEIEDCSAATMRWRIHQARKQLKRLLRKHLTP